MANIIEVIELTKIYKKTSNITALNKVSLTVTQGDIFALLGLNGAGKTTLIKILLDLIRPSSGNVKLFHEDLSKGMWKGRVGYLPELFQPPKEYTPQRLLEYLGALSHLRRKLLADTIDEVLSLVGLLEVKDQKVGTFSKGMILRLGISQALLHKPQLMILDEPTDGMDPLGKRMVRSLLIELRKKGVTIFLNSHLLSEIELVADRVAIINKGNVVVEGSLSELLPASDQFDIETMTDPQLEENNWKFSKRDILWVATVTGSENLRLLLDELQRHGISVASVKPCRATLEDIFFTHINLKPA